MGYLDGLLLLLVVLTGRAQSVTADCPWTCSCTPVDKPTAVNCAYLKLEQFPDNLPKTIKWLDLSENWIETFPPSLARYPQLRRLIMSGNRLSKISATTFNGLDDLIQLDLSKNMITSFSDINGFQFLQTNENLKTLNLSFNLLQKIVSYDTFISESLEVLDVSNCRINYLDEGSLDGLPNLTHLNISKNPLKWITEVDPLRANSLTYLDMSYCQLDSIRRNALEAMPNLHTFIVARNKQLNLDTINVYSNSLAIFDAEFCQFKRPALSDFPNLIFANLRGNKIDSLRAKSFLNNIKLKRLDLSDNHLTRIFRDAFLGLNVIEHLNLARNDLTEITWDMFITNYELKHINLSHNSFNSFPKNLTVPHLTTLSLRMCTIQNFDSNSLTRLPYLATLDLSQNLIKEVPDYLESNSLKHFDLSSGHLSSINNETFSKLPILEHLNLKSNRFTSIPKDYMFSSNSLIQSIELSDNPWICDCKDDGFKTFWRYLTDVPAKLGDGDRRELKCTSPKPIAGKTWEAACYEELYPSDRSATFLEHYGVYVLIIAMTASLVLVITVSVRQRMLKRDKVLRGRMEARRRQARENQERVVRQYLETTTASTEEEEVREERALSQPPTYEEAILMPRRETGSVEELEVLHDPALNREPQAGQTQIVTPGSSDSQESSPSTSPRIPLQRQPKTLQHNDSDSENDLDHDYDEVAEEVPTVVAGKPRRRSPPELDEAQVMRQLRIEVWSREDLDTLPSSETV